MKTKIILLSALIALGSCSGNKEAQLNKLKREQAKINDQISILEKEINPETDSLNDKSVLIVAQEMKRVPFNHFIEVQGKLDGDENTGIGPQMAGKVVAIYVVPGQKVSKGQILARLDDAVMQDQLKQMTTNLDLLTDLYEKQKNLWEQKVGSEVQYLTAKTNKESMENSIAALKNQIQMMSVISPIQGTVEDIAIKVGQVVSPGLPLIRVINFNRTKVVADLSESFAAKINTGDKVQIYFPDIDKELTGVVNFASRYINPVNRTFSVEAHINNPVPGLKANMVAILKINDYHNDNALSISVNLLNKDHQGDFVYIVKNSSCPVAKKVYVQTGQMYNGTMEITEGLNAGDKVISVGYQSIEDGTPVRF